MASTWQRLVSDGHRLGRQWLQGKLSEETARSLRQLVVDSGAASSSRATKGESFAILLEMFDRSSPVSRRLWCFSLCFFFVFTLHLQRFVCFSFAYQLYFIHFPFTAKSLLSYFRCLTVPLLCFSICCLYICLCCMV